MRHRPVQLSIAATIASLVWVAVPGWGQTAAPATQPDSAEKPAAAAQAQTPAPTAAQPAERPAYDLLTTPKLLGDWGGVRTDLENLGFSLVPVLYSGYTHNYRGGLNTHHAHDLPGTMQYNAELDFAKMGLVPGGSFFIRGMHTWNDGVRDETGSTSHPSYVWGSAGDHEILVDKWWWRQRFLDDRIEIRLGKLLNIVDLFDTSPYAGNMFTRFTSGFLSANPTIPVSKGIGAFVKIWPTDWLYLQAAAMDPDQILTRTGFDTAFHGPCHFRGYWEFGFTPKWPSAKGPMPGNYRFGLWYDPRSKTIFQDTLGGTREIETDTGDVGYYLNLDQLVWKETDNPKDAQGLGMFMRYGYAHGDVNRLEHFWSVGAQYAGLIPTRDKDVLGFGVGQGILSRQFRSQMNSRADRETVYEAYYAIEITPWMQLTPDIQIITNPGGTKDARDSIVGTVRVRIIF